MRVSSSELFTQGHGFCLDVKNECGNAVELQGKADGIRTQGCQLGLNSRLLTH